IEDSAAKQLAADGDEARAQRGRQRLARLRHFCGDSPSFSSEVFVNDVTPYCFSVSSAQPSTFVSPWSDRSPEASAISYPTQSANPRSSLGPSECPTRGNFLM